MYVHARQHVCECACVCVCARACVRVCVIVCACVRRVRVYVCARVRLCMREWERWLPVVCSSLSKAYYVYSPLPVERESCFVTYLSVIYLVLWSDYLLLVGFVTFFFCCLVCYLLWPLAVGHFPSIHILALRIGGNLFKTLCQRKAFHQFPQLRL